MVSNWWHRYIVTAQHCQKGASERHITPCWFPEAFQNRYCEYSLPVSVDHSPLPHKPPRAELARWEFKGSLALDEVFIANSLEERYLGAI